MNGQQVGVLLIQEIRRGARGFILVFAIVVPVVLTTVVTLLFGSLFSGLPRLGVVDEGSSGLVALLEQADALTLRRFATADGLRDATGRGEVAMGLVLPADFDAQLQSGTGVTVQAYMWGESRLSDRALLGTTLAALVRELAGQTVPVNIETVSLGTSSSWNARLMPFIVLVTILIGGTMLPATSIVQEKMTGTLRAITTTRASLLDALLAKGLMGVIVSLAMGIIILIINQAFGARPLLLVGLLLLAALFAAELGVLLGALSKDINTLFATIKGLGLLLYAPAIIKLFPGLPQWIGRIFPTYYMIEPITQVTQNGAGLSDVAADVVVLIGLIGLFAAVLVWLIQRAQRQEGLVLPA